MLIALIQAMKDIEGSRAPGFLKKPLLNYVPLLLLVVGGATFFARQFGPVARVLDGAIPVVSIPAGPTQPQRPSKNYFPSEKAELGDLLAAISRELNTEGLTAYREGRAYGNDVPSDRKDNVAQFLLRVRSTEVLANTIALKIWDDIVDKNPKYSPEFRDIVGERIQAKAFTEFRAGLAALERELSIFLDRFDRLTPDDRHWIANEFIRQYGGVVHSKAEDFRTWIQESNNKIDAMREQIR